MTASLTFTGTPNAAYTVPGTHTSYDDGWTYDSDGSGVATSSAFSRLVDNAICSGLVTIECVFDFSGTPSYWSNAAIILMDASLTGVKIEFRGDRIEVNKEVSGSNGSNIYSAAATNTGVITVLVEFDVSTGDIDIYKNSVLVTSSSYTDTLSGLRAGMQAYDDGTPVLINTLNTVTSGGGSVTVDSYPATVRSGAIGVAYTTTGLSAVSNITIGSLAATSISDTSGDGTHSIPSLTDGVAHELYGTKTVTITGTGGSPTTTTSFQPLSTQSFVTLSGTLNTTETGILYNFSPAAAVGDQIVWTTANGTVDAQGNYTGDFEGTQTMWHIDATDNVARSYDVITGVAGGVLKYWNGSAWDDGGVLKYWNGSAWVAKTLKHWNGSAWV